MGIRQSGNDLIVESESTGEVIIQSPGLGDVKIITGEGTSSSQTTTFQKNTGDMVLPPAGCVVQTKELFIPASVGHVGGAAGFTTNNNTGMAAVAASQTNAKFVIPVLGLSIGDTISAFKVIAQIESAGGTVTLDADLRKLTNAAADPVDASIGAITQVSVTADTEVAEAKTGLAEVLASGEMPYILLTATTAGSTDIQVLGVEVTVLTGN